MDFFFFNPPEDGVKTKVTLTTFPHIEYVSCVSSTLMDIAADELWWCSVCLCLELLYVICLEV